MSTAARVASQSAGRGSGLVINPRPTPVTQLPKRRTQPSTKPPAGRGTSLKGELAAVTRSSLTSSVLRQRDNVEGNEFRSSRAYDPDRRKLGEKPHYEKATSGRRDDPNTMRKIDDWYKSATRREALAGLAQATSGLEEASKRPSRAMRSVQPFAWADLTEVVNQLPDGHWAYNYVSGVASSIEQNDAIDGTQKEQILGEVLQTLGRLSREDDERFQDAES